MGSGFVLTYLLIAAVVAPLVWFLWWVIASLGDPRIVRMAPARATAGPRGAMRVPHAVDSSLPGWRDRVVIRRLSDALEVGSCHGPDGTGRCPRVTAGGTVPCAGSILALARPVSGSLEWHIPAGYRTCMLGSYDAFRQAGSPS